MKFRVEIECDNAAFDGDDLGCEVNGILGRVRSEIADCDSSIILRDINGNRVGRAWFEEDE